MALPDSAKLIIGTYILIADTTDYTDNQGFGARTHQIDCTGVAVGEARESDKITFPTNLDLEYILGASIEFATAPTAGETVDFYMGWSNSATAATNNPGGLTGSDADYAGYSTNLADSLKQLSYLGTMVATVQATTTVQIDTAIATFVPRAQHGILVVVNNTSDAFMTDAVEIAFRITPLVTQIQD
jgi:hypothetical protein